MKTNLKRKIIIVDDHLLFSQSLELLIKSFGDYEVIERFENGKVFIDYLEENNSTEIDLILLDVNMPVLDGLSTMQWLKDNRPDLKVIALSVNDDEEIIIKMITNGAKGYLLKDTSPEIFKEAIECVIEKGFYFTELVSGMLINKVNSDNKKICLKEKEIVFIKHACTEMTYKEIASEMCLSPKTIDGYRESLFDKLEIKTRIGLVLYAIKHKIVFV
ncbi:response regulator transcription factor [Flavobacterium anhuiense]|jgi:DNA-binding NarL/FixJ family response regulator|uniref:Two component transcriptional regulator, LuxR family n=1 Tax=Flavobacterium anhuiense TaxID=459526 RepID=A0ABY0LS39_9FLAO|nr:response regulator transcription factor [Flavobacterium anhuiense]URM35720.1 response regulator transcription factor [Flavobacterium anhuiense]SCY44954.1 two component transcriptional regulator, LuxR family [Flavobacterium anhuiense]